MKLIIVLAIAALISFMCLLAVAEDGLTDHQKQLLENGCSYTTVLGGCRHEHT